MSNAPAELYDTDFFAWTQDQASELRRFAASRPNLPLDLDHLAEEIEDLGKEQRNALRSWTRQIVLHLLLLQHSPSSAPRSGWRSEIKAGRDEIEDRLSVTLRRDLEERLPRIYGQARSRVGDKLAGHGEAEAVARLPAECPYTLEQVLDDWWPDDRAAGS